MRKILVLIGDRADAGLTKPIRKRIKEHPNLELLEFGLEYFIPDELRYLLLKTNPNIVLIPADRSEMLLAAVICSIERIPIAHLDAGEIGTYQSPDEIYRWAITRLANIIFTNTEDAKQNVIRSGEEEWRVHNVGYTCMDDVYLSTKHYICKKYNLPEDFDIVIHHPDPFSAERTKKEIKKIFGMLNKFTVFLYPNKDPFSTIIVNEIDRHYEDHNIKIMEEFDNRNDFLSALKYCKRFIGNSSAMMHEAPFLGTECVHIGERNSTRKIEKPKADMGASDKVVEILSKIEINEKLLKKKVVWN